jgi:hypothetical protein
MLLFFCKGIHKLVRSLFPLLRHFSRRGRLWSFSDLCAFIFVVRHESLEPICSAVLFHLQHCYMTIEDDRQLIDLIRINRWIRPTTYNFVLLVLQLGRAPREESAKQDALVMRITLVSNSLWCIKLKFIGKQEQGLWFW